MTIAENLYIGLCKVKDGERDYLLAAIKQEESVNRYKDNSGREYFLFEDDSVYSEGGQCWTKSDLLGGSSDLCSDRYDGLIRTFWPHALPKIGNMSLFFDTEAFSKYAGAYSFTFGTWWRSGNRNEIKYSVDVFALLAAQGKYGTPVPYKFKLLLCSAEGNEPNHHVHYHGMPAPEPNASWNNPLHWQKVVVAMKSHCASVGSR